MSIPRMIELSSMEKNRGFLGSLRHGDLGAQGGSVGSWEFIPVNEYEKRQVRDRSAKAGQECHQC